MFLGLGDMLLQLFCLGLRLRLCQARTTLQKRIVKACNDSSAALACQRRWASCTRARYMLHTGCKYDGLSRVSR